jgi:hypothetical protein
MSESTGIALIVLSVVLGIVGLFTLFLGIGLILLPIAFVLFIVGIVLAVSPGPAQMPYLYPYPPYGHSYPPMYPPPFPPPYYPPGYGPPYGPVPPAAQPYAPPAPPSPPPPPSGPTHSIGSFLHLSHSERYCPACGSGNLRISAYCHRCGKLLPPP